MKKSKRQIEIIEHTLKLIVDKGIQEFTTKNLANSIGITEAGLYRHYSSKLEILSAIIESVEELSMEILESVKNEEYNGLDKVRMFIFSRFLMFSNSPDLAYIIFNESLFKNEPLLSEKMSQMMIKHQIFLTKSIKQAQAEGFIRNDITDDCMFTILIGATRLLIQRWLLNKDKFSLIQQGDELWENLFLLIKK